jgi:three-Cys-motif partner protein
MAGRYWGIWTREKLDVLRRYLDAFTTASTRSREIVYLDLFAGQTENYLRGTLERLEGSARIALQTTDPPFTRLAFCELRHHAKALDERLRADYPGRQFQVYPGDCNETVHTVLRDLQPYTWAPTFAFIDPNGPHTHWTTLEALARHRTGEHKVELWLLLPVDLFVRTLPVDGKLVTDANAAALTAMFGMDHWRVVYRARLAGELEPAEARDEYVNLMRWRLQRDLGYRWTHPLEMLNEQNRPIYHMIFATDHEAGTRIMSHIYGSAAEEFPAMREAVRRRRQDEELEAMGIMPLFSADEMEQLAAPPRRGERFYEYVDPWLPYGMQDHC